MEYINQYDFALLNSNMERFGTCTLRQVSFPAAEQPGSFDHCKEEDEEQLRKENPGGVGQQDCLVEDLFIYLDKFI